LREKVVNSKLETLNSKQIQNSKFEIQNAADKIIHKTIKKVSDDIEAMRFNTAVSALMIALNELEKIETIGTQQYASFLQLLAPFAPHIVEELWASLGNKTSVHLAPWPTYDASLAVDNEVTIMVQINGKVRGSFMVPVDSSREELESRAKALPEAAKWIAGGQIKKVIVVLNKLVNIVV
jgi:leucyl-tRNA synthetase